MRRHERRERDPLRRDRREQRLRIEVLTVVDDDGRADVGKRATEVQRVRVAHRHDEQRRVGGGQAHVERRDERDQREAFVIANGSLGLAGRARRVHQCPGVGRRDRDLRLVFRRRADERFVRGPAGRGRAADANPRVGTYGQHFAKPVDVGREGVLDDHGTCRGVLRDVPDLGCEQAKVDGHRDEPRFRERDVDLHPLDAVVGENRHAIATLEAEPQQSVCEAAGPRVPLRVGKRTARIARADLVRLQSCVRGEDLPHVEDRPHGSVLKRAAPSD
jgi:hypothetical protein